MKINKSNFFNLTFSNFKRVRHTPIREPNFHSKNTYFRKYDDWFDEEVHFNNVIKPILCDNKVKDWYSFKRNRGARVYGRGFGSKYWYTPEGVYRESDHWGSVATCFWYLDMDLANDPLYQIEVSETDFSKPVIGFAKWEDFIPYSFDSFILNEDKDWEELSVIPNGEYLAFEFRQFQYCYINDDARESQTPLPYHCNHKSNIVNVIVGLDFLIK